MSARRVHAVHRALTTLLRPGLAGLLAVLLAGGVAVGAAPVFDAGSAVPLGAASATTVAAVTADGVTATATTPEPAAADPGAAEPALDILAIPAATAVAPGGPVSVRVTVRNSGGSMSAPGTVEIAINGGTRPTLAALEAWFAGVEQDAELPTVAETPLPALEAGGAAVLELVVPAEATGLAGEWGPRLVAATVVIGGEPTAASRTAVTFSPPDTAPPAASVRVVAALSTPGFGGALLTAEELTELTGPDGVLTRTLDALEGTSVGIGVDPRIIASVRLLGASAPESARALLDRLAALRNPTFALGWADADPTATILARGTALPAIEGAGAPLDPELLEITPFAVPGLSSPSTVPPSSASPSTGTDDPPVESETLTLEQLAAWPHDLQNWVWPREGQLSPAALEQLVTAGAGTVIASDAQLSGDVGSASRSAGATLAVADASASQAARIATTATVEQEAQAATAELAALLSARAVELPGSAPMITLDRSAQQSIARLDRLIAAVESLPWAEITPLGQPSASLPETVVSEGTLPEAIGTAIGDALDAEATDRRFARIAIDPAALTDVRRLELLAALSIGWGDEGALAAVQNYIVDSAELRSSVQLVETSSITLLSDRLSVPVTVQNGLDVPIVVYVHVESSTGQLRVLEQRIETTIEAGSQAVAAVPVQSLTNGEVDITVTVRDADAQPIAGPIVVPLNLQAGWETAGIVVLAIAIVGLFIGGLVRDIRRRRTRRAAAALAS